MLRLNYRLSKVVEISERMYSLGTESSVFDEFNDRWGELGSRCNQEMYIGSLEPQLCLDFLNEDGTIREQGNVKFNRILATGLGLLPWVTLPVPAGPDMEFTEDGMLQSGCPVPLGLWSLRAKRNIVGTLRYRIPLAEYNMREEGIRNIHLKRMGLCFKCGNNDHEYGNCLKFWNMVCPGVVSNNVKVMCLPFRLLPKDWENADRHFYQMGECLDDCIYCMEVRMFGRVAIGEELFSEYQVASNRYIAGFRDSEHGIW